MSANAKKVELLRAAFGPGNLSRDGLDINVACPKCPKSGKRKKKLSIRLKDGVYHCWVCGLKGQKIERLFRDHAPNHAAALRSAGFSSHETNHTSFESDTESNVVLQAPTGFTLLGNQRGMVDPDVKDVIRYCRRRGLTDRDLWYFKLGTCKKGRFRRRVIFPSFDFEGSLNYYTARAIDDDKSMKYINAKVSKKEVIFNEINIDWSKELCLVEGPFDLTKTTGNATCLLGSHLSRESILFKKIVRQSTPVVLALDSDVRHKTHSIAKTLSSYGVSVRVAQTTDGRDVGDMTVDEYRRLVSSAGAWSQSDRLLHLISRIRSGSII